MNEILLLTSFRYVKTKTRYSDTTFRRHFDTKKTEIKFRLKFFSND